MRGQLTELRSLRSAALGTGGGGITRRSEGAGPAAALGDAPLAEIETTRRWELGTVESARILGIPNCGASGSLRSAPGVEAPVQQRHWTTRPSRKYIPSDPKRSVAIPGDPQRPLAIPSDL